MQAAKTFKNHTIILVAPYRLDTQPYQFLFDNSQITNHTEKFDDSFFASIEGYNKLMLSEVFYLRFVAFDRILIYQLDAMVLKDELAYWANTGYDYIGAPWIKKSWHQSRLLKILTFNYRNRRCERLYRMNTYNRKTGLPAREQQFNRVGNGGFSLRNPRKFLQIITDMPQEISFYRNRCHAHSFFNEDFFWSLEVNRSKERLKIPKMEEAVFFAMEFAPDYGLLLTKGIVPFGVHDWATHKEFWIPIFKRMRISINL